MMSQQKNNEYKNAVEAKIKPEENKSFIQSNSRILSTQDTNIILNQRTNCTNHTNQKEFKKLSKSDKLKEEIIALSSEIEEVQRSMNKE